MQPNKARIRKWVEALRSGDYRQGQRYLKQVDVATDTPYHCCLGVACDVSGLDDWRAEPIDSVATYSYQESSAALPEQVQYWFGLSDKNPILGNGINAWDANDVLKWTFEQIADLLEAEYLSED